MHTVTRKILNILIVFISLFYAGTVIIFFYVSFVASKAITYSTGPGIPWFGLMSALILIGSTVYYFKTNHVIMKVISSVGCFSMVIFLVMIYLF